MVDAKRLLADLRRLHRSLQGDLREQHSASAQRDAVKAEWHAASEAKRTADTFETFWTAEIDQAAVHWILGVVFIRFLEDNRLLDRPFLSGPGERLDLALERQRTYVRGQPLNTDTDYLLDIFVEAAHLPGLAGLAGLYDPAHNPLFRLPLSGDGAIALLVFFRDRVPETGELVHDFTDPTWNTRFLGDLYQDLSAEARKRYALLQTPEFVEEWILDRTLDPAMREFGATKVRMIDPACGSGHFLLGAFARLLAVWQREAPDMPPAAQAQQALDAVSGVDLNPFAVEIARFRLLMAALLAAEVMRLTAAPAFRFSLAVGDSLLHGRHFGQQRDFAHETNEGFGRTLRHHYASEDTAEVDIILGRQYHAVVGNPPYITPKDAAMRGAYREIYISCHMKYGLGAPFTERFFDLALSAPPMAGYVGLIVANSFMKREFGSKLIEDVLPCLDLTHVVDCSGAYIPEHGIPTAILFGRNRKPVASVVRTVRGVRGEPTAPSNPAQGRVWCSIVGQIDLANSEGEFVSTEDTPRAVLGRHPWNMGGGGAAEVQALIEEDRAPLASVASSIGITLFTLEDDLYLLDAASARRQGLEQSILRPTLSGDEIRDWRAATDVVAVFPYDESFDPLQSLPTRASRYMWFDRSGIANSKMFGGRTKVESGLKWFEFGRLTADKLRTPLTITFGEVATHNHFALDRGGKVFNRTAPVIKLPPPASEDDHLGLLGLLNSSTGCFWLRQVCHNKGNGGVNEGYRFETWERFLQINGSRLAGFPVASVQPTDIARTLDAAAATFASNLPAEICADGVPTRWALDAAQMAAAKIRGTMVALQEELDWRCYLLYGLVTEPLEHSAPPSLQLGERAFEIALARRMKQNGEISGWFVRHGSTPITEIPNHWPSDYRALIKKRIAAIETNPAINLIERQECKRRWLLEPWSAQEHEALRDWLLGRLEGSHHWLAEPHLISTRILADAARHDQDFLSVAALYAADTAFNLEALVAGLVIREAVPFLSSLRYSETGIRKRADWEGAWEKQRQEDAIDTEVARQQEQLLQETWAHSHPRQEGENAAVYAARMAAGLAEPEHASLLQRAIDKRAKERKMAEVGTIPLPAKYKQPDFLATDFWRQRGGLDVPKERFVSFPHCARDADGSLPVLWAGYDHLARAKAIAAWYVERKETDGWPTPRLIPLLAGLLELVPWLRQWHNAIDQATGLRMGDYFADFLEEECRSLGLSLADLRDWKPLAPTRRRRGRRVAA